MAVAGVLLVDKPGGITSHDVVARARRALGTRKIGHAGTLDPMATGLLVLGVEGATRLLTHMVGLDKTYVATIRLGQATSTDDAEGEVTAEADAAHLSRGDIDAEIAKLTGRIHQVPSTVSAIKVGGRRTGKLFVEHTVKRCNRSFCGAFVQLGDIGGCVVLYVDGISKQRFQRTCYFAVRNNRFVLYAGSRIVGRHALLLESDRC